MPAKNKNLISTKEAGQLVGRSSDYVARLVRAEKIDGEKIGGTWLVEKDSLLNFFDLQEAQLNAQKEKLSSIRKQEYKESQDLIPKTKKFIETEIAHGVFTAHNLIAMTASVLLVFGGYLTVQAGPVKHFVSEIKEEVISAIYVVRREAAETLYSPKQVANLYNARSVNYVDVEPVIPNTFSVIENAVKEGGYGAGALREKYTVNDTQPLLQKVSLRDVSNSIFENYRAVGHAFLNAGLSFERAYLNGVYVFSGGLLDTGSVIASASDAAVDAYISSVYGFVNLAQAYPQTWIGGVYGFVDATPVVAHRIASVPYVVGDTLVDSVATLPKLQERFVYGVAENAPEVARSVTATTLNVGEEFVETSEKITQVYKQNVERVGEVGGSGYVYARITAPQILEDKVRVAAYRGGRAVAGVFEGVSEDVANRIASIVSGVLETQDYIVRVGKSVADTVVGVPSNTVARVSLPQEAGVVSAVQNFFGNLFGNKREPVLLVTQGALETKITEEVAEPVVTPVRTTPVTNNFYSFTDASVTQGYVDANLAALRSFILAEIDSLDVSVERSDGENYDNILDTLSDAVNGDLSPSSLTTTGTVTAGSFVGGTGSFATTTISNLTVSGDSTFSGTLTVGGITTTGPLSAPYFNATSTTATSTFAGGLNVGSGSFVYDLNSGNVGIGTTTPFTDFAVEGNSYFNGTLGVSGALTGSTANFSGLVVTNATTTSATTTNLAISGLTAGSVPFIGTGGVVREDNDSFFFDAVNGRLGIGTSTPRSSLDIEGTDAVRIPVGTTAQRPSMSLAGQIRYNTSTAQYEGFDGSNWRGLGGVIDIDQDTYITAEESTDEDFLRFYTDGGERFTITNTGNVGVGTSSPYARFSVVGQTVSEYFTATSTSIASVFPLLSSTSATSTQLAVSSLTSGRVPFVTAGGRLVDSANFTFDGSVATITDVISTRATTTNATSTNLSISNTLNLSGLTASRGLFLDANNNVVDSAASSALANSLTDETGTGSVVFSASPTLTGTTIIADASITNATSTTLDVTGNLRLPNLTPSRLVALTANGTLTNSDLASWVSGTSNQVTVTDDGDGSITLSLPSTLSFTDFTAVNGTTTNATSTNLAIESLTSGRIPFATAGGRLVDSSSLTFDGTIITAPQVVASSATATSTFAGGLAVETSGLVYDWQTNRVGIGTAGPTSKLHIEGSGQIADFDGTNDTGAVYARFGTSGSSGLGFVGVEGSSAGVINTDTLAYATYIGAAASGTSLQFGTPGGVRMTINPSGNVGIGTTNPSTFKLQVAGNVGPDADSTYDLGSDSVRWANIFTDAFVATRGTTTNATSTNLAVSGSISVPADSFGTNEIQDVYLLNTGDTATGDYNFDSNTLFIDSADNRVGIGTNNPLKGLHVQQGGSSGLTSAFGDGLLFSTNSASGARIFLDNLGGAANQKAVALVNENVNGVGTFYFGSLSDNGGSWIQNHLLAFRLDNGYVGIGTSTPYAKLSVAGSVVGEYFTATSTSVASTFPLLSSTSATSTQLAVSSLTSGRVPYVTTGGRLVDSSTFTFDGTTLSAPRLDASSASATSTFAGGLAIETSGFVYDYQTNNVGIGTAIPTEKLDVDGNIKITGGAINNYIGRSSYDGYNPYDNGSRGGLLASGTFYVNIDSNNDQTDRAFVIAKDSRNLGGGSELFRVQEDGNVGIGTTNPSNFKLQVAGNVGPDVDSTYDLGSNLVRWANIYADALDVTSATSTNFYTTNLGINSEYINDLTGNGLAISGGKLNVATSSLASGFFLQDGNSFGATAVLGTNDSNNLQFETGGTTRVTIDTDGDLGIGSTTPALPLSVAGSRTYRGLTTNALFSGSAQGIQFQATGGSEAAALTALNGEIRIYNDATASTGSWAASDETAIFTNTNKFGVGTSTPWGQVSVEGQGSNPSFVVSDTSNNTDFVVAADGNVGVGITNPSYKLDVAGNINTDQYSGYYQAGTRILYASSTVTGTFVGADAGNLSSTGTANTFVGYQAGQNYTGSSSTGIGYLALKNGSGNSNTAVGWQALTANTTGFSNTALGTQALIANTTGNSNTAFGRQALNANTSGGSNLAIGTSALLNNTTASNNIGIGVAAGTHNVTGQQNVFIGTEAGEGVSGSTLTERNVAIGYRSLEGVTTGSNNITLGYQAGDNITTGSNNIIIGYDINAVSATGSNQLNIGNTIYGDTSTARVGLGTTTPGVKLQVTTNDSDKLFLTDSTDPLKQLRFGYNASGNYGTIQAIQSGTAFTPLILNGSGGNIGIATTTPWAQLSVEGQGSGPSFVVSDTSNNTDFVVTATGNVGVGVANPGFELDTIGTARFGLNEDLTPDSTGLVGQVLIDGNGYNGYIAMDTTAQYFGHNSSARGLYFQTDETTRLAISGTGNVGIGATNNGSTQRLLVDYTPTGTFTEAVNTAYNHLTVRGNNNGYAGITIASPNSGAEVGAIAFADEAAAAQGLIAYDHTNDVLDIYTGGTFRSRFDGNGRLGIGSDTSPDYRLEVVGTSGNGYFGVTNSSDGDIFEIDASGNVGIGVNDPETKLEVAGGNILLGNTYGLQIEETGGTNRSLVTLNGSNAFTIGNINNNGTFAGFDVGFTAARSAGAGADEAFLFSATNDLGASDEVFQIADGGGNLMTVLGNGNVGVGTIAPLTEFHVDGGLSTQISLEYDDTVGGFGEFLFRDDDTNKWSIGALTDSGTNDNGFYIYQYANSSDVAVNQYRLSISNEGNVGIGVGNTAASNKLTVGSTAGQSNALIAARGPSGGNSFEFGHGNTAGYGSTIGNETGTGKSFIAFNAEAGTNTNTYLTRGSLAGTVIRGDANGGLTIGSVTAASTDNQSLTPRVTLDSSGRLGIGTTTIAANLTVAAASTEDVFGLRRNDNGQLWSINLAGNDFNLKDSITGITPLTILNGSGKVGIGTSTPQANLSISDRSANPNGTLFTQLTLATGQNLSSGTAGGGNLIGFEMFGGGISTGAVGGYMAATSNYGIGVWGGTNTGSPHLFVNNSGNVGIGTTSPESRFHVDNTITGRAGSGYLIKQAYRNTGLYIESDNDISVFNGGGRYITFEAGTAHTGIGTDNPSSLLDVAGTVEVSAVGATSPGIFGDASGTFIWSIGRETNGMRLSSLDDFYFYTGATSNTTGTQRMIIDHTTGNVGIGTSTPTAGLHVNQVGSAGKEILVSDSTGRPTFSVDSTGVTKVREYGLIKASALFNIFGGAMIESFDPSLTFYDQSAGGDDSWRIHLNGGALRFYSDIPNDDTYDDLMLTLQSNSHVLVGDAARTDGNIFRIQDSNGLCQQNPGSGSLVTSCSSDERLKSDIVDAQEGGLAYINDFRIRDYTVNADGSQLTGVIAQEVLQTRPEMVSLGDNGFYLVEQPNLWKLVQALQELDIRTAGIASVNGNIGIGTDAPSYKLHVIGDVAATSFVNISTRESKKGITYLDEARKEDILEQIKAVDIAEYRYEYESNSNPLRLGLIAEEAPVEILSVGGKGVDIYKLATFTLAAVQQLAVKVETLEERVALLEAQVAGGGSGSGSGFSTSTITAFFAELGILIEKGFAQFDKLAFRELVATEGVAGAAAAGSVTILEGNKVVEVENAQVLASSKIFVTFTSSLEGGWFIAEKQNGSFRVELDTAQSSDVSFDYFIVQTERSRIVEGGTESEGGAPAHPGGPEPVITIIGDNPMNIAYGSTFTDPGAYITDDVDPDISYDVYINGLRKEVNPLNTRDVGEHEVAYHAVDDDGNVVSVIRIVNVLPEGETAPEEEVVEEEVPVAEEEVVEETPAEEPVTEEEVVEEVADTTAPVITLSGKAAMKLEVGAGFTDPGATATDDVDGDVTSSITVSGAVDISKAGVYTLTYSVADAAGNEASAARTITVSAPAATPTEPAQTPEETVVE